MKYIKYIIAIVTIVVTLPLAFYFVPFNVIWVTGDVALRKRLQVDFYQEADRGAYASYDKSRILEDGGSFLFFRNEYGEHRIFIQCDSSYAYWGWFKIRSWYKTFVHLHFYSSEGKNYMSGNMLVGLDHWRGIQCIDQSSEKKNEYEEIYREEERRWLRRMQRHKNRD